jgi:predicted dehydrogenase
MSLRVALIGCGEIGKLRAAALARVPAMRLVVVCDADRARAASLSPVPHARVETDWRRAVAGEDLDVVIVSTPPSSHAEIAIAALGAGKHVLCEKPLARNPIECRSMTDAAARAGRVLATGFNYRFYPPALKARELVDSGVLGRIDHVRAYTGYSAATHHQAWLHDAAEMGGGALRDNGIHLIDLTRWFLGDVAEISGRTSGGVWGFDGCEDNGFAILRGVSGATATLQASWTEWLGYQFRVEVYGTLGALRLRCFPMLLDAAWSAERGGKAVRRRWWFSKVHVMEKLRSYRWVVVESFVLELETMARAIAGEKTPLATGIDGLRAVEIADAISRSSL